MKNNFIWYGSSAPYTAVLMALCDQQNRMSRHMLGRIVNVPGKGKRFRKAVPILKNMSIEDAISATDVVFFEEEDSDLMGKVQEANKVCLSSKKVKKVLSEKRISFSCTSESLVKLVNVLIDIQCRNYRFSVYTDDTRLYDIMAMFFDPGDKPDFVLYLNLTKDKNDNVQVVWEKFRETISDEEYWKRLVDGFGNWKNNLHPLFDKGTQVYCSGNHRTRQMNPDVFRVFSDLRNGVSFTKSKFKRTEMEEFAAIAIEEQNRCEFVSDILRTSFVEIHNENEFILSFIGSHRCNFRCSYCFSDHRHEALSKITVDQMYSVADMITDGKPVSLHIDNNLAGEPLMDFEGVITRHRAMLSYHKQTGLSASFGLLTNGSLLNQNFLDDLRHENLIYLGFSLDGDPKTHNTVRRDANLQPTYDRTVRGLRLITEGDWPVETGISCVLTKNNLNISALERHFRDELGIKHIVMKPVRAAQKENFALTYADIPKLREGYSVFFDEIFEAAKNDNTEPLFSMLQPLDYAGRFFLRTFYQDRMIVKRCGAGEVIYSVDDSGRVYPCDSFNGTEGKEIGNLDEGMHNKEGFRIPYVTEKPASYGCTSCWARFICGGVCAYVEHLNNGRYNDVIRMECELALFLSESAIRFWVKARNEWKEGILCKTEAYVNDIGVKRLPEFSLFYAPC